MSLKEVLFVYKNKEGLASMRVMMLDPSHNSYGIVKTNMEGMQYMFLPMEIVHQARDAVKKYNADIRDRQDIDFLKSLGVLE